MYPKKTLIFSEDTKKEDAPSRRRRRRNILDKCITEMFEKRAGWTIKRLEIQGADDILIRNTMENGK